MKASASIVLAVDLQSRLLPVIDGGDAVLGHAVWMVELARSLGVPVLATEQYPQGLGPTVPALRARLGDAPVLEKIHFSALADDSWRQQPETARPQWIVIGTEAHVCVQQTVFDLLAAGREVFIVEEAVGSRTPRDKALALERMRQHGAEIVSREMVAFEWLERADDPRFREVLKRFIR
ncbi:hydrolase [Azoarcus olearius]|nr:hydrolase [Azoarcus olearius]